MSREEKQQLQQAELQKQLWSIANTLRGNMDANDFKNYILGLIFYRYLSENLVNYVNNVYLKDDNIKYEEAWKKEEYREALKSQLINDSNMGYFLEADYLWSTLITKIKTGKFDISMLAKAVNTISESTLGNESEDDFENLFEDMDLNNTKLGKGETERTKLISKVMLKIDDIDFHYDDAEIDVLGDAYEYLIGEFAASAGKKAGEFYTPQQVSKILAKLVTLNKSKIQSVYDPTCGSGSLLLRVGKEAKVTSYYGQEFNSTTYNLARMNMLLHGISFKHFDIKNDDTLEKPKHLDMRFDAIVANPPYSANWSADQKFMEDERFSNYGFLAPTKPADYAFVQHMIYQLKDNGIMAVVLPHGVLFRPKAEKEIRKYLIKNKNYLDAVISLPKNIFYGTKQATVILVFKKCRENSDSIFFIDASREYERGTQNIIRDIDIDKIIDTYSNRKNIELYSKNVSLDEIEKNDFDLSISKYIELEIKQKEYLTIEEINFKLNEYDFKINEINKKINDDNKLLGLDDFILTKKIRFKKSNGDSYNDWEYTLLSDVLIEQKEKNQDKDLTVCSVAVEKGVVNQIEHLGRSFAASDTSKYKVVKYGDVVYTKSPTGKFPYGIVKQSFIKEDVVVSPLYAVYKPINFNVGYLIHKFFYYPNNANEYLHNLVHKGAKNTINIKNDEFVSKGIMLPTDLEEQEKLVNYFMLLDEKKKLELAKKELLEMYDEILVNTFYSIDN